MRSRFLSGTIVAIYLVLGYFVGGGELAFRLGMSCFIPLLCIWFSQEMGDMEGGGMMIGRTSPGCVVALMGWVLLLLPVVQIVIVVVRSGD